MSTRANRRIVAEPPPDPALLARADALEAHLGEGGEPDLEGMTIAEAAEWLRAVLPGALHGFHDGPLPPSPTDAAPGSEEKIAVLRARARRGFALHHPADRQFGPAPFLRSEGKPHVRADE